MTREEIEKAIETLRWMLAKGYKRYKVDSEVEFEFFSYEEIKASIRDFEDMLKELDGKKVSGSSFTKKRGYDV